jgi:hypothetical protein
MLRATYLVCITVICLLPDDVQGLLAVSTSLGMLYQYKRSTFA